MTSPTSSLAAFDLHVSLAADTLFELFGFPITNALLTGFVSVIFLAIIFGYVTAMVKKGRYNRFVGLVQWAFEGMLAQVDQIIPNKKIARSVAPVALTMFFFVLIAYWMSILPGLETIKYGDVPILRSLAADLNFTFALAIISIVVAQVFAIMQHGFFGNLRRYIKNPFKSPIAAFEGILELIGEVSRYSALSLRLFGNCFAGEILLIIMSVLTSYFAVVALPLFMAFELFIGFIQAYVFFVLTVIFTSLAVETHAAPGEITQQDHQAESRGKATGTSQGVSGILTNS